MTNMGNESKRARIYLYTGEGEGKTMNALGLALRTIGHGKKAVIIQFMKGRKWIGEYKIMERLKPDYEIYQFGREEWVTLSNPGLEDKELAEKGLDFAGEISKKRPELLVLDEINLATAIGLLRVEDVLNFLDSVPEETTVVMTGRRAPKEFIERADLVTVMQMVKHPYQKGIPAREGIEF